MLHELPMFKTVVNLDTVHIYIYLEMMFNIKISYCWKEQLKTINLHDFFLQMYLIENKKHNMFTRL